MEYLPTFTHFLKENGDKMVCKMGKIVGKYG